MASVDYCPDSTANSSLGRMSGQGGHSRGGNRLSNCNSRGQDGQSYYHNRVSKVPGWCMVANLDRFCSTLKLSRLLLVCLDFIQPRI
jgi:hypothetical protein